MMYPEKGQEKVFGLHVHVVAQFCIVQYYLGIRDTLDVGGERGICYILQW